MNVKRDALKLREITQNFIQWTLKDDPALAKSLEMISVDGRRELGGVIGRFISGPGGVSDPAVRLRVRRLVGRLHKPEIDMLVTLNRTLDYMDLNADGKLDENEMELCLQLFERFSGIISANHTLSAIELELLYAVLRFADRNQNGRLEETERKQLMSEIQGGRSFLRRQFSDNPEFRSVAEAHQLSF
ncbi:MAG: hypothetical protein RB296_05850 [Acidobacteriota bacterium]|jgi:hypothetical protein|nr:hypothetical protein [Acidobacteriota bacterium]